MVSFIADHSLYKIVTLKENIMRKAGRISTMKERSIGTHSPPVSTTESEYGSLKRFGTNNIKKIKMAVNVF